MPASIAAPVKRTDSPGTEKTVLTYSAMNAFRNCPRKYRHHYLDHLRPLERADSLAFGSVVHEALELWYRHSDDPNRLSIALDHMDANFEDRDQNARSRTLWHQARAMMAGFAARYPREDFEVVHVEREFEGEIRNPDTGACSRAFSLAGKVDGIVRRRDGLYLLEHKTAARVDAQYLDKLWTDTQIHLYSLALRAQGFPIRGIIYNVLLKTRLVQGQGETEEEFEARRRSLAAKNKTGRSNAKRRVPETDEAYQGRLSDWYAKPEAFHRELLLIDEERLRMVAEEAWEITRQMLDARSRDRYLCNTSFCFAWQRPCEYFPLCQSGDNPALLGNLYETALPHEELASSAADSPLDF